MAGKTAKAEEPQDSARVFAVVGQLVFVGLAALIVYSFVSVTREGELRRRCSAPCLLRPNYLAAEKMAPNFSLTSLDGNTVSLESFRGKVVILNFWTKFCDPCLQEMPEIAELTKMLHDRKDVAVVTVSVDEGRDAVLPTLKAILHEEPPFWVLFDPENQIVAGKYGTKLFPETWIIDKRGVIRMRIDGARQWSSSTVVEFVDQVRSGGYCPVDIKNGHLSGEAGKLCEVIGG